MPTAPRTMLVREGGLMALSIEQFQRDSSHQQIRINAWTVMLRLLATITETMMLHWMLNRYVEVAT